MRARLSRGQLDAVIIFDAIQNHWDELQEALATLPENEKTEFISHFNSCIEGQEDLGDILFGNKDDFRSRLSFLDDEVADDFAQELLAQEVLDKDELEGNIP